MNDARLPAAAGRWFVALGVAALLGACGGGGGADSLVANPVPEPPPATGDGGNGGQGTGNPTSPPPEEPAWARGTLLHTPPALTAGVSAAELQQRLRNGETRDKVLLELSGNPVCDVRVHQVQYTTVGGAAERTTASAALMLPSGTDARCNGARPLVVYAHGTNPAKRYNLARLNDADNPAANESLLLAALFAAQGMVVLAPNYAGYDSSTLGYHPFLNAEQQSKDMVDALTAARTGIAALAPPATAGPKLFLTGYSQGGHVALATQRAMEQAGMPVTASAPMSGPYALAQQLDDTFAGKVYLGGTLFGSLLATSYQKSYGNVYAAPAEFFAPPYTGTTEALLPGDDVATLLARNALPEFALFSSTPPRAQAGVPPSQAALDAITPSTGSGMDAVFARGFGPQPLIGNAARLAYLQDAAAFPAQPRHGLRQDVRANDLRGFTPQAPVLLCGGEGDATVPYPTHTAALAALWAGLPAGRVTVLDVDARPTSTSDPFIAEKLGFALVKEATATSARLEGKDPGWEVARGYHAGVFPFCASAARRFFARF